MGAERHHRRQVADDAVEHVLADDGEGHAGRGEVLLRTAVNHRVLRDVHRTREDIRRHVGDQRHGRVDVLVVLRTVDRIVRRDMQVVQIGRDGKALRDIGEVPVLGGSHDLHFTVTLGLLDRLLRPDTRVHIAGLLAEEVRGNLVEERAGTAAQVDDLVVVGNRQQFAKQAVSLLHHRIEILRTMRNREYGESRSIEIKHGLGRLFDHLVRQDRGSGVEIVFFHTITRFGYLSYELLFH